MFKGERVFDESSLPRKCHRRLQLRALRDAAPCCGVFVPEDDPHVDVIGVKGIGEIGTTGVAGEVANAVYHATGIRVRDLPITLDTLLGT